MKYKKRPKSIFLLAILCIFPLASFGKPHAPVNFVLGDTLPKQNTVALETILNINNIFSYQNINKEFPVPSTIKNDRAQAETVLKEIENKNAWVNIISSATIVSLPVGIKSRVNDVEYAIGIAKATIQKDYTELTVFVRAVLPQTDERGIPLEIFFAANTIKLSHDGGLFGNGNLVLLGDVQIPFNAGNWLLELKGGLDYKKGVTENLSYVTIDCSGVKEMGLTAEVQFSRNLILPVTKKGKLLPETKTVKRLDQCMQNGGYSYSAIHTFTTPSKETASEYNCGIPPEIIITNQEPLQELKVDDVFTAGDFEVTVKEVSGGNGSFSGRGFIVVPYLGNTKLSVGFDDIHINTDKQLTDGFVATEYTPE